MAMKNGNGTIIKYLSLLLTVIGLIVGMVVWASTEHATIKDWTLDKDHDTRIELRADIKDKYVPKHEFIEVKTILKEHQEMHKKLDDLLYRIEKKLDKQERRNRVYIER